jgi:SAM-dependent methyltransferase
LHNYRTYEWYQGYRQLRHLLNPIHFSARSSLNSQVSLNGHSLKPAEGRPLLLAGQSSHDYVTFPSREDTRVLILGCGNSTFGADMIRDGWAGQIVNIDFSSVVIDQMQAKYNDAFYKSLDPKKKAPRRMQFICADMTRGLPFETGSFDLVVSKGSFDAVLTSAGSVGHVRKLVQEIVRVLAPGHGVFFLVTHSNPDNRVVYLEHDNDLYHYWDNVSVHLVHRSGASRQMSNSK